MKTINLINWLIIAIYGIYALLLYFDSNRSGMDAAGRGMAMGFLIIGLAYIGLLTGLNLINIKWVKILVLLLGGLPLIYFSLQSLMTWQNHKRINKLSKENHKFLDPHLNAIMLAIKNCDIKEVELLLEKDKSQINHIGVNNRKTILGIAVRNSWTSKKAEANDIVYLILKNGADPNIFHPDTYGVYGPLASYGQYIDIPVFEALLKAGANPIALGEHDVPLLYTLIERDREDAYQKVTLLLKYGLDPNIPLGNDQPYKLNFSPLIWAAVKGHWTTCSLLVNKGSDVNFQPAGPDGRTFWFILDQQEKKYRESGNMPSNFQELISNEKIVKHRKSS